MPLYDVEHVTPLNLLQQTGLAQALTNLHATRFKTPKIFVNVRYTDVTNQIVFRGGRRVQYNRIILRTRQGEQRTKEVYDEHCRDIVKLWDGVVVGGRSSSKEGPGQKLQQTKQLRTVWVMGALTTAVECGIARPGVGEEDKWLEENMDEFKRLAEEGDGDFVNLLQELES
ncbi:hypothetical protein LTR99_009910 [Exophiala xenobiotica]|uniref:Tautomerase cis-CaaD-like domain-containing protein n=1 Tax=Vermiconidia calcicola TaxID=1690605 RepID=A0AAV9Q7G5_9PEZI|nr:hypothetical protein LTR92_005048 [Exophiala xenobiotica]KAK5533165.1 hypothetical protein LTR23_009271 [Chaetothyriales sp. CCFEE 6169]KAK5536788.1 hypothetical protein LTR25_005462 [Vermiconidia calcicola]KAK5264545.1 hypothetical protein LTR96_010025 [Exophiala xenobiotica]KAK5280111.1 hypothetical protein LTR40_006833 [Exophiala xenobiotica]